MIAIRRKDGGISLMWLADPKGDAAAEVEKWKQCHQDEYLSHEYITIEQASALKAARGG